MFNGNHYQQESGAVPEKRPTPNKAEKPDAKAKPVQTEQTPEIKAKSK